MLRIEQILQRYAEALTAWAEAAAMRMLKDVEMVDRTNWFNMTSAQHELARQKGFERWSTLSANMARALKEETEGGPLAGVLKDRLAKQVSLIKSIPLDAAKRVHELSLKGLESSTRGEDIRSAILASGDVATSRATLIARTEVARTASLLTQARAEFVGSTHYIWRTSGDTDVRAGHRAMNGKVFRWDDPPEVNENGRVMRHHPGQIWNCRCYPEPIIPD